MIFQRPLSKHYPILLPIIRKTRIILKSIEFLTPTYQKIRTSSDKKLYKIYAHNSQLKRKYAETQPELHEAKITNLKLAVPKFQNIIIPPQSTFSFWKLLGEPSYEKGFQDGMVLADGVVLKGMGGGMCQIANIIHWLFLHTDLEVKEHWHHNYDMFPDSGRSVPFGTGAGILYNYFDLQYFNSTNQTYTLHLELTETDLVGIVYSDTPQEISHSIKEENHRFFKENEILYRENFLYKVTHDKTTGNQLSKKLIKQNKAKVMYELDSKYQSSSIG